MNQTLLSEFGTPEQRVERAIAALREGRGVMVLDDENRENDTDYPPWQRHRLSLYYRTAPSGAGSADDGGE